MSWQKYAEKLIGEFGNDTYNRLVGILPDDSTLAQARKAFNNLVGGDTPNAPKATKTRAPAKPASDLTVPKAPAIIRRVSGAEKRAPSSAKYSREEMGQRYPEVGDPVMTLDKKKGTMYPAKGPSDESVALANERARVVADMKNEGYTPFFNPEDRYYVNPADYPLVGNTLNIKPAKQMTIDKYETMANDPEALARLMAAYQRGAEYPGAKQWYAMGQLEDQFKQGLGVEDGQNMFKQRFADAMAATTGGMDPDANFRLAHYMNYLKQADAPTPQEPYELPYPIGGGRYGVMPNISQYERLINQGAGLSPENPKRFNFSGNFLGHLDKATLDEQMMTAFDPKLASPPANSYGIYEGALAKLARQLGVSPAEAQDVMWAGIKLPKDDTYKPRPMIDIINDAIERTSRLTGVSPDEVVQEGIVKAKRPMYADGGLTELADRYAY